MSKLQDSEYLLKDQYNNAEKLNARIRLHAGFSTNTYGWFPWVFDHFDLPDGSRLLELGCGPGDLWLENRTHIPPDWEITLSDFSPGMLAQAQENLSGLMHQINFKIINAQQIPFRDGFFDAVIANHCLYHVPNQPKAISEIHRVLKSNGQFFATTIGLAHLAEMTTLIDKFDRHIEDVFENDANPFTLENGIEQLRACFSDVSIERYPDGLKVTESEPLVDFLLSSVRAGLDQRHRAALTGFIEEELAANGGVIHIQKDSGIFISRKR